MDTGVPSHMILFTYFTNIFYKNGKVCRSLNIFTPYRRTLRPTSTPLPKIPLTENKTYIY